LHRRASLPLLAGVTLLDRHVLREWFSILGIALAATVGLLLMHSLYSDLEDLLAAGARLDDLAYYFTVKIPGFFATVFPIVLLVSLLYSLGRLHYTNEITAMRAAGLGLFRITRGIWVSGVLFCGLVWVLNATVVPWSVEASRVAYDSMRFRQQASQEGSAERVGLRFNVSFHNQKERRMWFFNRYSEFTRHGYGVSVVELDAKGREQARLLAGEAWFDGDATGAWQFRNGREITLDPERGGETVTNAPFERLRRAGWTDDPELMTVFGLKPDDLSVFQLRRVLEFYREENHPKVNLYAMRYYGLQAEALSPLIIIAIAVPFAVGGVRVNPAVGVSKSIGLFVLYFLILKIATALGARDAVPPLQAAILPNLALLAVGLGALARAR
jgi:lipopolysaccharide export system permease protein